MKYASIATLFQKTLPLMTKKRHLFITGSPGRGKSALMVRLLCWMPWTQKRYLGLRTLWKGDTLQLRLLPPYTDLPDSTALLATRRNGTPEMSAHGWAQAAELARTLKADPGELVWIDEIGWMEQNQPDYLSVLYDLFAAKRVIACLRRDRCPLWHDPTLLETATVLDLDAYYKEAPALACADSSFAE